MWDSAFRVSVQRVTDALLRKAVLPSGNRAFERVSAAMVVRAALLARQSEQTLLFQVPEATAATARHIAAALLVGNHAHTHGVGELPADEARPLFKGDVLLVTAAVSACKAELDALPIGAYNHLHDYWEVVPLSKYTMPRMDKPRVFLANPGWMQTSAAGRRFGAVIVDASHPRSFERVEELTKAAIGCSPLRIVVTPPMSESELRACGYPDKSKLWIWDPESVRLAEGIVCDKELQPPELPERVVWVCDSDLEASEALSRLYRTLAAATKAAARQPYPGLAQCWSLYNRLRHLAVPLAQLEQVAATAWAGSLRDRVDALQEVQGHGSVAWETTWPALRDAVASAYATFLKREETAKFWALAANVESFLASRAPRLRIVVPTQQETDLLHQRLDELVDGVATAVADGRLEIVTFAQEARLVAEGDTAPTHLLGPRANGHRYLDVFPSNRVDQLLYPHELNAERTHLARLYDAWTTARGEDERAKLLLPLGFRPLAHEPQASQLRRPGIAVRRTTGHAVELSTDSEVSGDLDIEELVESGARRTTSSGSSPGGGLDTSDHVDVVFTRGGSLTFYTRESIDVYFSESGEIHRHPVTDLKPGWQVISFVDGRYDSLFKRLTEVVNTRLPVRERTALELWQSVKDRLVASHSTRRALYEKLRAKGLETSYDTFTSWFRDGEEAVIAPQQRDEFDVLARETPTYQSDALREATFTAVQHARGRNRAAGRKLKQFLRAVVSGDGYGEALESARKIDAALADVLAAVEVLEVVSITRINRSR